MPTKPLELCDLAERLIEQESCESAHRAAASRAYYAAFHELLSLVEQLPKTAKTRANQAHITHEDFAQRLGEWKTEDVHSGLAALRPTAGRIARAIDACRSVRKKADYRLGVAFSTSEARMQVERVRQIFRAWKDIQAVIDGVDKAA